MNILNIIHYPVFGGPHNRAARIQRTLSKRGYKSIVLIPSGQGNAGERLKSNGVNTIIMPLHRVRATLRLNEHITFLKNFWKDINAIRMIIKRHKIELTLISGLVNPHAAISGALERIPVVWQITDTRTPNFLRLILLPIVNKLSDAVMFNGQGLVDVYINKSTFKLPFFAYYPPVDTVRFNVLADNGRITKQKLGIPEKSIVVGTVANINPQKGIEFFIRAASNIFSEGMDCYFVVIGARYHTHKKYNKLIKSELSRSPVPRDHIIFTGERLDVENYYSIMDIKLITSVPLSEGTTTTAMEAMACGIPVIATDVGSVREVVEHGKTGFVVPPLDHEAVADAALRLLKDHELRQRMGAEARRRAVEKYDVEVCADTHVRAFEAAIAHHRLRRS